jgi:hypothetical protein
MDTDDFKSAMNDLVYFDIYLKLHDRIFSPYSNGSDYVRTWTICDSRVRVGVKFDFH